MLFLACVPLQPPTQPVNWVQCGLKAAIFFRGPAVCCAVPVPVVGGGFGIAFVRCSRAVPSAVPQPPGSPAHSPEMARSSEILRGRSAGSSAGGVSDRVLQAADGLLVGVGGLVGEHGVASGVGASLAEGLAQAMFRGLDADLVDGPWPSPGAECPCECAERVSWGFALLGVEGTSESFQR